MISKVSCFILALLEASVAMLMLSCSPEYIPICDHSRWPNASASDVQAKLDEGTDVNAPIRIWGDYRTSPLHLAAECNSDPAVVELLLKHGADVHARDPADQNIPLYYATRHHEHSNTAVVALLLEHGADPNVDAYVEVCGERPNGCEIVSTSILYSAVTWHADPRVVMLLLEHGANPNIKNGRSLWGGMSEETPLHGTVARINSEVEPSREEEIIRLLLEYGADINVRDDNGRTPCQYARAGDASERFKDLLCR